MIHPSPEMEAALALGAPFELMRFPLTYDGLLPPSANDKELSAGKLKAIWDLRNQFHLQLKHIYETKPVLCRPANSQARALSRYVWATIEEEGIKFHALVHPELKLLCELDIEMFVNHDAGTIVVRPGDLDGRIKTVFDALRVPKGRQEFGTHSPATQPCHCLLFDDAIITKLAIQMDRYPACPSPDLQWVRLRIVVNLKASELNFHNEPFRED